MQRYTIEDKLGEGGMGVVYRARQNDLNRLVAIKYLLPDGELTEVALARFKREMDVLMSLSHPNIIKVFDAGTADGKLFYAMEMLDAHDLSSIVRDKGKLPAAPVASVLAQVLDALAYIHGRGLIHRDIKPANIMLEEGGRAVLMDFGLVRKSEGTMLTTEGKLLGTPRYFAPEYIRGDPSTLSSDIWALGVTAYELLSGERPFLGGTLQELALAIVKTEPVPLERAAPDAPPALARVVMRMLEKDPRQRYGSATACLDALREATDPDDLDRSSELSQELSIELMQQLAARRGPAGRKTGKNPRLTGKTARATRPMPRLTASKISTVEPPKPVHSYWAPFVLVCAVIAISGIVHVFRGTPAPAAVAALAPMAEPRVEYTAPDRLTATFRTPDATVWTLNCDGVSASDASPVSSHAISVAASPLRAPEKIVLSSGARVLEVRPPAAPRDRVRGLEKALASLNVSEKSTDQLWHQIRQRLPEWKHVSMPEYRSGVRVPTEEGATPAIAQRGLKADPTIGVLYELHVKGIRDDPTVKRHLEPLLALAPALLMSEQVPLEMRDELLGVLFRLDLVDGLGEYIGYPPPFQVASAMRPAYEVDEQRVKGTPEALPAGVAELYRPAEKISGFAMFHKGEDFLAAGGGGLDAAVSMENSLVGWEHGEEHKLGTAQPVGPGGRRVHLWIYGLSTQLIPYLVPQGYKNGLPIRHRGKFYGLQGYTQFTVTLRGPLADPGYWKLYLRRLFEPSSRTYYGLTLAGAESIPR